MQNNTIYLSNLSYQRDRNGVRSLVAPFGRIKNIKIIIEPTTEQSRGMAFVELSSAVEAKKAIEMLDQKIIDGRTLKAKYATPLKESSVSRVKPKEDKKQKDLNFKDVQLMKKARNQERRSRKPF